MNDEEPMYERRPLPPERRCGATTRKGGKCGYPAGHGTDHVGFGRCRRHGGNSPNGRRYAYQLEAIAQVPTMGGDLEVEPTDALLYCVRREAGRQAWLRARLELEHGDVADPNSRVAELARLETAATERLARFSAMALKCRRRGAPHPDGGASGAGPCPRVHDCAGCASDGVPAVEPGAGGARQVVRSAARAARSGAAGRRGPGARGRIVPYASVRELPLLSGSIEVVLDRLFAAVESRVRFGEP